MMWLQTFPMIRTMTLDNDLKSKFTIYEAQSYLNSNFFINLKNLNACPQKTKAAHRVHAAA